MTFVGIDCGKKGGIVVLNERGYILQKYVMPLRMVDGKNKINIAALNFILSILPEHSIITIEQPGAHAASAAGLRSMTYSFAQCEALLFANGHADNVTEVMAQKWQRTYWNKKDFGIDYSTKKAAKQAANRYWPNETWLATKRSKVAHDGMIDAALIGFYGLTKAL